MLTEDLYPLAPAGVPDNFTHPSTAYRMRTFTVLTSLFLFLMIYLFLIAAVAYAGWWLAQSPPTLPNGKAALFVIVAYFGGLICLGMLLLLLVKGLFKGQSIDRSGYIPVHRREQPELFRFIDRICEETSVYCGPVLRHSAELMLPAVDLGGRVWLGGRSCKGGPAAPAFGG